MHRLQTFKHGPVFLAHSVLSSTTQSTMVITLEKGPGGWHVDFPFLLCQITQISNAHVRISFRIWRQLISQILDMHFLNLAHIKIWG